MMCFEACFASINKENDQESRKENFKLDFLDNQSFKIVAASTRNQVFAINAENEICHDRSWQYNPNRFSHEPSSPPLESFVSPNPVGTEVITSQPHRSDSEIIFGSSTPKIDEMSSPPPLYGSWFQLNDSRNESPKY